MAGKKAALVHVVGQITLRQRGKKGLWHARYTTPTGRKEHSLKVTNLKAATKKAREINDLLESGEHNLLERRQTNKGMLFSELVEEFSDNYLRWADSTKRGNAAMLGILVAEFGHLPLNSISVLTLENYLSRRQEQNNLSIATMNRYVATLKTIFKTAVKWGYLSRNPASEIKIRKESVESPKALTKEQLPKLFGELSDYGKTIVTFAVNTGMRSTEMKTLQWADVNFVENLITVRGSDSKNSKFRVIPMSAKVFNILRELHEQNQQSETKSLNVFHWRNIRESLSAAGTRAGVGHVHMHMLRHTFATRLRDEGVPLDRIKELLGHKSMTMVLRYAQARPEHLREAIHALDE